jgi:hypothetical protein
MRHDHSWTGQYPAADTDFAQTLIRTATAGGSDAQTGQSLLATLGLNVEAPDFTADTVAQAAAILQRELAGGASPIVFRYNNKLGNAESLINITLTNNMMLKYGVHGVKYSMHQDTRAPGYTIVTIQVSYLKR